MNVLLIAEFILLIALFIFILAAIRVGTYKTTSMGLLSSSAVVVALALALFIFGGMDNSLTYFKDIVMALVLFGFVGTIVFSVIFCGGDE